MDVTNPLGPLIALFAGLISFLSPCMLPLVPIYITHLAGASDPAAVGAEHRNDAFRHALSFVVGFSVVFIFMGASVGLLGFLIQDQLPLLTRIAGVLLIAMGLHLVGILRIPFLYRTYALEGIASGAVGGGNGARRAAYARSLLVGSAFSIGWTPCIGPILGAILALAANSATVWQGAMLLFFYSVGLGIPFLATGLALGTVTGYLKKIHRFLPAVEVIGGVLVILVGSLIFLNRLTIFNQYFDFFGFSSA